MTVTEEEAKTKRCCGPSNCGETRGRDPVPEYGDWLRYCIGSKCMAWRKYYDLTAPAIDKGYCGLAGG